MYDALVVGLGAMGSAALYHLAARGGRVIGVDAFSPPHTHGSTHGRSRITRQAYYEHPSYVPLVRRANVNWARLEEKAGTVLYRQTGGLMLGAPDSELITGSLASASLHSIDIESLEARDVVRRFPAYAPTAHMVGVFERSAGILYPEACVRSHLDVAHSMGAEVRTGTKVLDLFRAHDTITAVTPGGNINAKRLVMAAGPWTLPLLERLGGSAPLVVERQSMHWFETSPAGQALLPEQFPVALMEHEPGRFFYVMPDIGDGVKAAIHHEGAFISPDSLDREVSAADTDPALALVSQFLPAASSRIRESAVCLYTDTPDGDFIIDYVDGMSNVVLVSACSGHGFKFASAIGEIAAELALQEGPTLDISHFRASRFA